MLLAIFKIVMDEVERHLGDENLEQFRRERAKDYNVLIVRESLIGENVSVDKLAAVTDREVGAGRMPPDHELRKLAVRGIGAAHLSPTELKALAEPEKKRDDTKTVSPTGWLDLIRQQRATELTANPLIRFGVEAIRTYWTEQPDIKRHRTPDFLKKVAARLTDELIKVAHADDPLMYNRGKIVQFGTMAASWQVLLIDPAPRPDPTGLRGRSGISGQLGAYLHELRDKITTMLEVEGEIPNEELYETCLVRYRQSNGALHVFGVLRFALNDYSKEPELDWFVPLIRAQCALAEAHYREILELPETLSSTECSELATLITLVQAGEKWPTRAWERRYGKTLPAA